MGLVAAAVTAVTYVIVTSRFGLRLMTIREDEVAAEAMGIDTFRYKLYAFLLSAVGPGHRRRRSPRATRATSSRITSSR